MNFLSVIGTRPEAIKMCPLILELRSRGISAPVLATGQHGVLLDEVMMCFGVEPIENLALMEKVGSQGELVSEILCRLPRILIREKPDAVLVHGDTTTAFAAALACFYEGIPVCHVEAGLRTYRARLPFPEEFNRRAVALTASLHFAPTEAARENLLREGILRETVFVTGNTGLDALRYTVRKDYRGELTDFAAGRRLILVTAHRRENLHKLGQMMSAIADVAKERKDIAVVVSAHPNPPVRRAMLQVFADIPNVRVVSALGVEDFHNLLARSFLVLTDSGGIQEEAPVFGIPVLVMRSETERPEGLAAGTLRLIGTSFESIREGFCRLLDDPALYEAMKKAKNPYGDGKASVRIADILCGNIILADK